MDYSKQLQDYTERDYALTPLRGQSKEPIHKQWQTRPTDLSEFTPGLNVGIVLGEASGGLIDIDLDDAAALIAAPHLLPPTASIFGRASKLSSHWLYRSAEPGRTMQLRGSDGHMIVELRADGAQTMAPPSLHPDGECVEFQSDGDPATATRAGLETACRLIAAVVELAPHYTRTSRHAIALAFAGVLVKAGQDVDRVRATITALCAVTDDEELDSRLAGVDTTIARHQRGEPVSGWKALRELLGSPVVDHLAKLLDAAADDDHTGDGGDGDEARHDLNDAGNADRLAAMVDGNLGYVPEIQTFIHCEGGRWRRDESGLKIQTLAEQAVQAALREAASMPPRRDGYKAHVARLRFFEHSLNLGAIRACVGMTKPRVAIPLDRLDADPDLLGVRNGVLDLRMGRLRENARADYITRSAGVAYEPSAQCPVYARFMTETFVTPELIRYVDGLLGYCLSGHNNLQEIYFFIGEGKNGKSTLLSLMLELMREYARPILASTLFEGHRSDQADYDLGLLPGIRLAIASEAESRARLHAARLKAMSGGDTIAARPIGKAPFFFRPCAKIIMVANRRPELDAYDEALKRRIRVIPFEHQVPEAKRDPAMGDKLAAELPGILNRLVSAGADFIAGRIPTPECVLTATTGYFFEKDVVAAYLAERVEVRPNCMTSKACLYADYAEWCKMECLHPLSQREFTRVLRKKGHEEGRSNSARGWKNLWVIPHANWAHREDEDVNVAALMSAVANTA